jgi:hypothetical protein
MSKYRPDADEMMRRLRLGNLTKLFQHRYGRELPDDDAGREDLRELLLVVSLGPHLDTEKAMQNIIETRASWMAADERFALIANIERTPTSQRKPTAKDLGERLRLTNAERERLKLWTIGSGWRSGPR